MEALAWRAKADGLSGGLILVSVLGWLRLLPSLKTIFKLAPSRAHYVPAQSAFDRKAASFNSLRIFTRYLHVCLCLTTYHLFL